MQECFPSFPEQTSRSCSQPHVGIAELLLPLMEVLVRLRDYSGDWGMWRKGPSVSLLGWLGEALDMPSMGSCTEAAQLILAAYRRSSEIQWTEIAASPAATSLKSIPGCRPCTGSKYTYMFWIDQPVQLLLYCPWPTCSLIFQYKWGHIYTFSNLWAISKYWAVWTTHWFLLHFFMELLSVTKPGSLPRDEYLISPFAMNHVLQSKKDINMIYFNSIYFL